MKLEKKSCKDKKKKIVIGEFCSEEKENFTQNN